MIETIPGVAKAVGERSPVTLADLDAMVTSGEARIWHHGASAVFVSLRPYDSGEVVLHVGPAGGAMDEVLATIEPIEAWARDINATQVHVHMGREGWRRELEKRGYEVFQVIMRKVLD